MDLQAGDPYVDQSALAHWGDGAEFRASTIVSKSCNAFRVPCRQLLGKLDRASYTGSLVDRMKTRDNGSHIGPC